MWLSFMKAVTLQAINLSRQKVLAHGPLQLFARIATTAAHRPLDGRLRSALVIASCISTTMTSSREESLGLHRSTTDVVRVEAERPSGRARRSAPRR